MCFDIARYYQTSRWEDYFIIQCQLCTTLMYVLHQLFKRCYITELLIYRMWVSVVTTVDLHGENITFSWSVYRVSTLEWVVLYRGQCVGSFW